MGEIFKGVSLKVIKKTMAKKYYYALFDNQIGQTISTGINKTSKNSIRNHLLYFLLLGNFSEEGEDSIKRNSLSELLNYYEFTLLKSGAPFNI